MKENKLTSTIDAGATEAWTVAYHPKADLVATGTHSGNVNIFDVKKASKVVRGSCSASSLITLCHAAEHALVGSQIHDECGLLTEWRVTRERRI